MPIMFSITINNALLKMIITVMKISSKLDR
jgi:hypothetical protein